MVASRVRTVSTLGPKSVMNGSNGVINAVRKVSPRSLYLIVVASVVTIWMGLVVVTLEYLPSPSSTSSSTSSASSLLKLRGFNNHQQQLSREMSLQTFTDCPPTPSEAIRKPEFTYSLRNPLSPSPFNILHTVTTRFMIGQPHQPILAHARYLLMETFCWPTMKYQTRQNFFWIVLVDPRLDPQIIQNIQTLLTASVPVDNQTAATDVHFPSQNAFLVLTDNAAWAADGVGVPNVTSYGVGLQELAREYRDGNVDILSGNTYHLMNALELLDGSSTDSTRHLKNSAGNQKPILMIETLLDADDGLNNQGIEWIQNMAIEHATRQQEQLAATGDSPTLNSTWWVLCGTDHIEWHNRDIYKLTNSQYETMGLTAGVTGIRHAPLYCTSAGYTRVGSTLPGNGRKTEDERSGDNHTSILFPLDAYSNHALAVSFPFCNATHMSGCLRREFDGKPYILKSRSITSDSMDHMNPKQSDYRDNSWENKTEHPLLVNDTERTWIILQQDFSINRLKAWDTSVFLRLHAPEIVRENQASHCAPGFPCRLVAQRSFKKMNEHLRMMDKRNERDRMRSTK
ncbi:putative rhamnosyl transferase [Nitzschia inconspicua]|uniref:Rhamnosyl transferase n=1 Tax=Nitzschia inconspicua TaxID=303405 RepID=A0A9K3KZ78_9STRA|nr:putative rhamnosyl transferase [Nitzschia inconspicua]